MILAPHILTRRLWRVRVTFQKTTLADRIGRTFASIKHCPITMCGARLAQGLVQGGVCMRYWQCLALPTRFDLLGVSRAVFSRPPYLIGIRLLREIPSLQQWFGVGLATTDLLPAILLPGLLGRVARLSRC
jgi:hypothetical protein